MQSAVLASSSTKVARSLLSLDPPTRNATLNHVGAPTLVFADPLLAPAGGVGGLARVKALLAAEAPFVVGHAVEHASFDQGAEVLDVATRTVFRLPVLGMLRLESEGRVKVVFGELREDEVLAGSDDKDKDGGRRLVIRRIERTEAADEMLASFLPRLLLLPLSVLLTVLLPLAGFLLLHAAVLRSCLARTASRRPSGVLPALLNPLDTAAIACANGAVFGLALAGAAAGVWEKAVERAPKVVAKVNFGADTAKSSVPAKRAAASSPSSTPAKHLRATAAAEEEQLLQSNPVPGVAYAAVVKDGEPPASPPSSSSEGKVAGEEDAGEKARPGAGKKAEEMSEQERYPHHEEVVEGVSFAGAVKSGVEGLDERLTE